MFLPPLPWTEGCKGSPLVTSDTTEGLTEEEKEHGIFFTISPPNLDDLLSSLLVTILTLQVKKWVQRLVKGLAQGHGHCGT